MPRSSLKVLIVEDQFLIAKQIELVLTAVGHEIVGVAADRAGALRLAASRAPDLTLVDVSLADGLTGPAIAKHIVDHGQGAVLFTTANVKRLPADCCGAVGSVEKPFTKAGLLAAVDYVAARLGEDDAPTTPVITGRPSSLKLSPGFEARWQPA